MGFVPQNQNIFTSMTVEENLEMGAFIRKMTFQKHLNKCLNFPIIKIKEMTAENFRGAKAAGCRWPTLMTQPKILMLDEPTAGVSPIVMDELFDRIIEVSRTGIPILMVEQNARQALK